jgi:hypothetical protein
MVVISSVAAGIAELGLEMKVPFVASVRADLDYIHLVNSII